jgi:acyl-CoA thioesterase FadM
MPFTTTRTILFGDCDPAGIIYTPRVAYFVVEAVQEFVSTILGGPAIREMFAMGILPPARALSIEYMAPMTWDDKIIIQVTPGEQKTTSFTFLLSASGRNDEVVFRASMTQVCVSPETKRPVAVPERLAQALTLARNS